MFFNPTSQLDDDFEHSLSLQLKDFAAEYHCPFSFKELLSSSTVAERKPPWHGTFRNTRLHLSVFQCSDNLSAINLGNWVDNHRLHFLKENMLVHKSAPFYERDSEKEKLL